MQVRQAKVSRSPSTCSGAPNASSTCSRVAPVAKLGPVIERHEKFPQRVNVGFAQVVDRLDQPAAHQLPPDAVDRPFGVGRLAPRAPEPGREHGHRIAGSLVRHLCVAIDEGGTPAGASQREGHLTLP